MPKLNGIERLVISAPFGNYISCSGWTNTIGTYTVEQRAGIFKRWWRVLSTVRPCPYVGGWVNRLGLPNPGIYTLNSRETLSSIISVYGSSKEEWRVLREVVSEIACIAVEVNLSCPNIRSSTIKQMVDGCLELTDCRHRVIAKLPPIRWMDFVRPLYNSGIRAYHLCNTLPTVSGGLSGKPLMPLSLWAVEDVRQTYGNSVSIIGGGGVTSNEDVVTYCKAGADHVSTGSALLNPLKWGLLRKLAVESNR